MSSSRVKVSFLSGLKRASRASIPSAQFSWLKRSDWAACSRASRQTL